MKTLTRLCPCCMEIDEAPLYIIERTDVAFGNNTARFLWDNAQHETEAIGQRQEEEICNHCTYWMSKIAGANDPNSIRANGHQYWRETGPEGKGFQPYGGRKFSMHRTGSDEVELIRMWDNDQIPEWALEYLPDNWEFVK